MKIKLASSEYKRIKQILGRSEGFSVIFHSYLCYTDKLDD